MKIIWLFLSNLNKIIKSNSKPLTKTKQMIYNMIVFSERQVVFEILRTEKDWLVKNLGNVKNETTSMFEDTKIERVAHFCAIKVEPRF